MSRLIFRINPHTDGDIIAYLEKQPNRSDAIRCAIRQMMDRETAVNDMLQDLSRKNALDVQNPPTVEEIADMVEFWGDSIDNYLWLISNSKDEDDHYRQLIQAEIDRRRQDAAVNS